VADEARVGAIDVGSGNVRLGSGVHTRRIDTGSGNVKGGAGAQIEGDIDTGSGSVNLGVGSKVGKIDTGSGDVSLEAVAVSGTINTGSGDIDLVDTAVSGSLETSRGNIELEGNTHINGDLIVRKDICSGFCNDDAEPSKIVIGASVRVQGEVKIERDVELWVHQNAQIGRVTGAEVKRFSGERP